MTGVFTSEQNTRNGHKVLVLGQNEALYRFLCACVSLKHENKFEVLVCTPMEAANADIIDIHKFAQKFGWNTCATDCTENSLLDTIREFRPDVLVSVLFPKRISQIVLNSVKYAINFHPSLLPKHRGSLTQFWSVFDGDSLSGVTCHHMVAALDEGAILDSESCEICVKSETAFSLNRKLMVCFEVLSKRVMDGFFRTGEFPLGKQQSNSTTPYHFRKFPNDGYIDPTWASDKIDRYIRAMHCPPYPGAKLRLQDGREYEVHTLAEYELLKERQNI